MLSCILPRISSGFSPSAGYASKNEFKNLTDDYLNKKYEELIKYKKDYYEGLDSRLFIEKNRKLLRKIK